jgi:hypothetical protein
LNEEQAARYFERYEAAERLYDEGRYGEAIPLLEELVATYPADPGTWYRLGRAALEEGRRARALEAYRRAVDLGYRYGASLRYGIARLYALEGRQDSALVWLERSLSHGYGDRPAIEADSAFQSLADAPRFDRLLNGPRGRPADRVEGWRGDIDYFVAEARRMHAGPGRPAHSERFQRAADVLKARVPELSDDRLVLELGRLATLLGDGHTGIFGGTEPGSPISLRATSLPLLVYEFTDGLFVVDATDPYRDWIGAEVLQIGGLSADAVLDSLPPSIHGDNAMTVKWLGVRFVLTQMAYLRAIGAAETLDSATVVLRRRGGGLDTLALPAGDHLGSFRRKLRPPPTADSIPLWLSDVDRSYWFRALPEDGALFVQFNQVRDAADGPSLATFSDSLRSAAERGGWTRLILDTRHNNGGNNSLVWPLLRMLVWWTEDNPDHELYVVTGRNTFSAAQNFIARLERMAEPTFVGEPSSSSPNFTGETTTVVLPWSRVRGSISNRHWQESDPDDRRPWIAPHVPVGLSSEDYFRGHDPALEAIRLVLGDPAR